MCIVTPGTRSANNGNWRTAVRWAALLRHRFRVIVQSGWSGQAADALIALHARRSAEAVDRFAADAPGKPIAVVLTGTDLYKDLPGSREAARTLDRADRIVVLQEDALRLLGQPWKARAQVIFQSAPLLAAKAKPRGRLDAAVIGHLREEKDPRTLFAAVRMLPDGLPIRVRHIGGPLDAALADEARALAAVEPRYRYTGALAHGLTRAALQRAHVLVHPSVVEGGANVIVEAVTAGTPVIASRISGNVGMLGADYAGYFEPRDAKGLRDALVRALEEPAYLARLRAQCKARKPLFRPEAEGRAVCELAATLVRGR